MASKTTTSRRLITPKSWGIRQPELIDTPGRDRVCSHCSARGLVEVRTIAGMMMRCPRCKQLQF
ncbi:hypothetical protein PQU96_12605 [Vogesella sp. LYT5W]|uniref:Uncharacterized protein n=1 Tax=Vogesella margarita TaxID=2984199 RepID=A0ABT5IQX1_9NEIS|nr:hypothetical protein [Vogesella margarita]MDC7714954.1 hypothetical protein [Vogesella margarita]